MRSGHQSGLQDLRAPGFPKADASRNTTALSASIANNHIVPVPGTKKRERLAENLGATVVELSERDLKRLDETRTGRGDSRSPLLQHVQYRHLSRGFLE